MDRTNSKHHIFLKSKLSTTCHLALNHHRATASEKKKTCSQLGSKDINPHPGGDDRIISFKKYQVLG